MIGPRPPPGRWLRAAALTGGVPALGMLALLLLDLVRPWPGVLVLGLALLAAVALARLWLGNLGGLAAGLRRAAGGEDSLPRLDEQRLLPAVREVAEGATRLARTLQERSALVEQLRRADAAIIEALPDPLLVLADDRRALRTNAAARVLLGGGARPADVAALLRHPLLAEAVDRALAEGRRQEADIVLPVPVARELAAQVIPLDPPLADGGRLIVVLGDRTRDRAVERMRADFVANASHELRTPLASLIGFIETLRGPARDDPAAQERFLGIMAEQSERMRRLVDDLLSLSRIELTEHQPPTGQADLAAIARAEADALAPLLARRRSTLECALPDAAPVAPAEPEQIAQVVRNLLDNAIRHGREGGRIHLAVRRGAPEAMRAPAAPGLTLTVGDDGPGIPREEIPRLTERFYRVDRGRSRAAGGTGLGLAIVKHIVNRHRGRLLIESEPGAGARFHVWLPASEEAGEAGGPVAIAPRGPTSAP
ncbi:MAG TPA: ATP-binding protein [Acetobacteraceae bacterium]|nr:ATP-binding protein [Acetobacteraceae bacterium]